MDIAYVPVVVAEVFHVKLTLMSTPSPQQASAPPRAIDAPLCTRINWVRSGGWRRLHLRRAPLRFTSSDLAPMAHPYNVLNSTDRGYSAGPAEKIT